MKLSRKTIIPVIAFLSLSFTGCADFLDTTPHDSLNSDNALIIPQIVYMNRCVLHPTQPILC